MLLGIQDKAGNIYLTIKDVMDSLKVSRFIINKMLKDGTPRRIK